MISKRLKSLVLKTYYHFIDHEKLMSTFLKIYSVGEDYELGGEIEAMKFVHRKLKYLYKNETYTLFDVGANVGGYSLQLSNEFGDMANIHAFEPLDSTFQMLKENTNCNKTIIAHHVGMSDIKTILPVYTNEAGSGLTSIYHRRLNHFDIELNKREDCSFTTVDEFCKENDVSRIHFMKIDVEGHELSVLKGAKGMIETGMIDFIQFEFGGCDIDSRTFFQDFWYMLSDKYNIYKIIPIGLYPVRKYSESREIFICANYLAELKS